MMMVFCVAINRLCDLDDPEDAAFWFRHCNKERPWAKNCVGQHYKLVKLTEPEPKQ